MWPLIKCQSIPWCWQGLILRLRWTSMEQPNARCSVSHVLLFRWLDHPTPFSNKFPWMINESHISRGVMIKDKYAQSHLLRPLTGTHSIKLELWLNVLCIDVQMYVTFKYIRHLMQVTFKYIRHFNQSINQISIAPISPAKPGSVARQRNQCPTANSRKQFHNINRPSGMPVSMRERWSQRDVYTGAFQVH